MHPILFQIGDFFVGTYGLLIVAGLVAAVALALRFARRHDISPDFIYDLAFISLVSGFAGARLLFILLNLDLFFEAPLATTFSREGFVFMGGFAAASGAGILFIRKRQVPLWDVADIAAPSLALGHAFGRIGCFAAGCCYGKTVDEGSFWGVHFPHVTNHQGDSVLSFTYFDHLQRGLIDPSATASAAVLPVQLFESTANFVICGLLLLLWRKRKFPGQIFIFYLFLYGTARFGLEFLRGDVGRGVWFGVSTSQIFSLLALGVGLVLWNVLRPRSPVRRAKFAHGK